MALVQGAASSSAVTSGTAGASLTGVTAGHGLVCFVLYESAATAQTLTDSSGTKWGLWNALTLTGSGIAVFHTTSAVVAGTHTVTASFTGGSGAWTYLFEDDQSPTNGVPTSALLTAPGAGNSIKAGTLGITGSSVYQLAVNRTHSTSGFQPQPGDFSSQLATGFDSAIGAWQVAGGTNLGGSNLGAAVGPSDSTGADNYAVLAMAFQPSGTAISNPTSQLVLVTEDVGPIQRTPYPLGMFFNRSATQIPATPLAFLSIKTPPWEFYRDTFTSVYPVVEFFSQSGRPPTSFNFLLYDKKSFRIDTPEDPPYPHTDHAAAFFQFQRHYAAQLVGYTTYLPDFCDDPWLELVHRPASPEAAIMPFRQIPTFIRGQQFNLFFNQPKPWQVEGEVDTVDRKQNYGIMLPWGRPAIQLFMPNVIGLDVVTASTVIENLSNLPPPNITYEGTIYPIPPVPAGIVIGQWPLPGAPLDFPFYTLLIVSNGLVLLPDVGDSTNFNTPNSVIGSTQGP